MNITRAICPVTRYSLNANFYRNLRISACNLESTQATVPKIVEEKFDFEDLKVLERVERRKPAIQPFMKNVFLSKFDRELLAFPEIINKEDRQELDLRIGNLEKTFKDSSKTLTDKQNILKSTSMYAAPIRLTNGGLCMNVTERLRYLETLSTDHILAKELSDHWVGLDILQKGLDAEEYQKLLPELTSGDTTISLCLKELISTRVSQADFRTKAEVDQYGTWHISGEKICHKTAGYHIVLAMIENSRLKAFLIRPNAANLSYKDNVVIMRETPGLPIDHISDQALTQLLGLTRLDTSVLLYSMVRNLITDCIKYVRGKFAMGKPLAEVQTIQKKIASALMTVYAAESTAFFTSGLLDGYEDPDAVLEMAMCRNFITYHGTHALLGLLSIPGLQHDSDFESKLSEFRNLAFREEEDEHVNTFIALNGLHYVGQNMSQEIKQLRNPLMNPMFFLKKVASNRKQERDDPDLTLHLSHHLHPTMAPAAQHLEYTVLRMRYACECLMARYGLEISTALTDLERLSQAATEILAMTSVLARASRSYCIGLRNSEVDMKISAAFCEKTRPRVKQLILDLDMGEYVNLDKVKLSLGKKVLDTTTLLVESPIERTFW